MRITREVDYAFRICAYLAEHEGDVVGAPRIAADQKVPERFTLRILRKLNLAGITEAKRGATGGYKLKRKKEDITLYDIIVAVDGPIVVNRCLYMDEPYCNRNEDGNFGHCKFHNKLSSIQNSVIEMFRSSTLDEYI
ncbi:RrF2 family transcriptional regulator [Peptoniphilus stercorisuis]|uniref:Rrf2 family protein n=1 Tax=Peptoniphilus stercorisuis TaxID=1436965 RepID=A0ABS4KDU8_9FIRM|nr:Rrf2 family transcriptional regulator [Peptoniphilus stercorisuis]MBP2025944.1 Rrf2 family protein [Peptoniphilus stercorisuis]